MKVPTHHSRESVSMAELSNNPARGVTPGMAMDKGRKTQGTRRTLPGSHKTFGVPLTELVHRAPHGYNVPFIVKKICTYLEHNGMDQEGIFRVNGSQKIVEKLKLQFDHHGHANLEEDGDVMAIAGLLKMFLRELPESVIPEHMTRRFVNIQEEYQRSSSECVVHLKSVLNDLPSEHYDLLKHVVRFLAVVACNEPVNKMSPMALAIVFGPNLFRCGKGFLALKDQGTTNQIVYRFIMDYENMFKDMNEDSPAVYWERKKHNLVPPRPPPPKFSHPEEVEVPTIIKPVPLPRKSKMKNHEASWLNENEDQDWSESSVSSKGRNSHSHNSPSFSDDEMTGRLSPFHLDSDSGFSLVESPVPSARTSEFVDKAIKATVIGHMFGDESSLLNASIDTTLREDHAEPGSESLDMIGRASDLNRLSSEGQGVMERVKQLEHTSDMQSADSLSKHSKQRPTSKAFEMFEKKGIIITQMMQESGKLPQENGVERTDLSTEGQPFEGVQRDTDTLQTFKRPAGPQNRRSPSRRTRSSSSEPDSEEMDEQEIEVIPNGHPQHSENHRPSKLSETSDINHNNQEKTRIAFLDIRHDIGQNRGLETSPEKSPDTGHKPFVPPLDFSTLHENVGSQDAIPANKAGSVSYHRAKQLQPEENNEDDDFENETPSPRSHKVKRKAGPAIEDDEFPPFSQADQDQYKLHSHGSTDDELTSKMKAQMRKVQSLKKKIRHFEEMFERENGYKPSHAEKAAKPEIKKFMLELSKARKEAKRLKEEAEMGSRSRHGSGASSTGERTDPPELPPTMAQTLDGILKRLQEKRRDTNRPEDIELMSSEQVQEEKLAVQKALLHFEGIHGRPKSKEEKDLMRPLYDRYRMIKRMLSRQPMSPRRTLELQTVPEDQPMIDTDSQNKFVSRHNFNKNKQNQLTQIQNRKTDPENVAPVKTEPIRVPTALIENNEELVEEDYVSLGTMDFAVTRDFSILKTRPKAVDNQGPHSPKARRKLEMLENNENRNLPDSNLHELSIPELQDELLKSRNVKKKLRKTLRDFEENFTKGNGRKVGREDRVPMQAEYNEYKQLKARLKLLEALLSKHRPTEV